MTLKKKYIETIVPALIEEFDYSNAMQAPKITMMVVNVGIGDGAQNAKLFDAAFEELAKMTGQKPKVAKAKKSIAGFKLREGMPVGAIVTLRGERMYDFLTKLIDIVLPRIRDFRGISPKAFDGRGNYNLGLKDQLVFPEIDYDKVQQLRGMNITIVTTAKTDREARVLMEKLGFPFQKPNTSVVKAS
jgi:large subunit ribosomal protein L5